MIECRLHNLGVCFATVQLAAVPRVGEQVILTDGSDQPDSIYLVVRVCHVVGNDDDHVQLHVRPYDLRQELSEAALNAL